ncbi:MAG: chromosome segregation protein ScpA [Planctomycetes bacterium]|nr:chromosome segregation protein ScpA [Planctomycetota bacterium]
MVQLDYTVRLERVFQGPMDLLLHLVREQEVEIHEIQIQRIVDGYLGYLKQLQQLDLELAGDFAVMAATLIAIKARSLLPREEVDLAAEIDPRDELVQRLIEYRRFRLAAQDLELRHAERLKVSERGWRGEAREAAPEPEFDLGELTSYDLLTTWSRLVREINANKPHRVATDPRPLRYYVQTIANSMRGTRVATLSGLIDALDGVPRREAVVGSFCALLELARLGVVHVEQGDGGGEITLELKSEIEGDLESILATALMDEAADEVNAAAGSGLTPSSEST